MEAELDIADNIRMELKRSQDISIVGKKREDRVDEFLTSIDSLKKDLMEETGRTEKAGICLRWVLGTVMNSREVILMAQVRLYSTVLDGLNILYTTVHIS